MTTAMNQPTMPPPQAEAALTLSEHQKAIIDALLACNDNLIVQAAAGSGKTTTLKLICNALPSHVRVLAVCFNKSIANEFQKKLPGHIEARTLHSVGFSICRKAVRNVQMDDKKPQRVIDRMCDHIRFKSDKERMAWRGAMLKVVSIVMATRTDPADHQRVLEVAEYFGIDTDIISPTHVVIALTHLRSDQERVSFDDMLDAPLHHDYPFPSYDLVLVDEAQDLNAQQLAFVERLAGESGRIIAVGDRNQAIYGFRGADHAAMDRLQKQFKCRELPLSVCYRCAASIIQEAQDIVGVAAIQHAPGAVDGAVFSKLPSNYEDTLGVLQPGDMIICRTNRPLVEPCFNLIRRGVKAVIRGRDIGKGLQALINQHVSKASVATLPDLVKSLTAWRDKRTEVLLAQKKSAQAQQVDDQVDTLLAIAENVDSIHQLQSTIEQIFSDDVEGVLLSSIHRAKGLEADTVVILAPELLPHPMAKRPEELQQEKNLSYVARTRARHVLVYQPLPKR